MLQFRQTKRSKSDLFEWLKIFTSRAWNQVQKSKHITHLPQQGRRCAPIAKVIGIGS